jgi:hypothetical protein
MAGGAAGRREIGMPSKGSDDEKRPTRRKPVKAGKKLQAGSEVERKSPGWEGPPNKNKN